MRCPLCRYEAQVNEIISSDKIIYLWKKMGISVSYLFKSDIINRCECKNCGLGFYDPPCPGDDNFYGELAEWDWYYKHPGKTEYEFTANLLSPGTKLVDIGCGIGEFSRYLPEDVEFLGMELSSKPVEIAKSLLRNVQQLDITNAQEYFKNSFDVVTCFQVLEHITDIHSFISALVSLCKPNGIIVIAVPNNDGFMGKGVNVILNMPPHHVLLWNNKSLNYLAGEYALTVVDFVEENLADVHRRLAYFTITKHFFNKILSRAQRSVDISFAGNVIHKFSSLLAIPLSKFNPKLISSGHSSIIVLRKPMNADFVKQAFDLTS